MKLRYLKSALKCNCFDVAIVIKIPFLRVSATLELGRSLLQFVTTNCLIIQLLFLLSMITIITTVFKQFVVTNCSKERPGSIETKT